MTIKGEQRDSILQSFIAKPNPASLINKREQELLSDRLIANAFDSGDGIWEYPPLNLLSDSPGKKADRGDIKKLQALSKRHLRVLV